MDGIITSPPLSRLVPWFTKKTPANKITAAILLPFGRSWNGLSLNWHLLCYWVCHSLAPVVAASLIYTFIGHYLAHYLKLGLGLPGFHFTYSLAVLYLSLPSSSIRSLPMISSPPSSSGRRPTPLKRLPLRLRSAGQRRTTSPMRAAEIHHAFPFNPIALLPSSAARLASTPTIASTTVTLLMPIVLLTALCHPFHCYCHQFLFWGPLSVLGLPSLYLLITGCAAILCASAPRCRLFLVLFSLLLHSSSLTYLLFVG